MFCQVMPLFGDMKMKPFDTYVKNSVHFNANKWPLSNSSTTSNQVDSPGKGLKVVMYVTFSRPTSCTILRRCARTTLSLLANSPGGLMVTCNLLNRIPYILTQAHCVCNICLVSRW